MSKNSGKLNIGIVGLGIGKNQINAFRNTGKADVVALCDTDRKRLEQTGREYQVQDTYTDMDTMIQSQNLDAVAIATPNYTHHSLTLQAFEQGLHVLCEKPLAVNFRQAQEMVQAAEKADLKLGVHYNHRMSASAQLVKQYITNGILGDVYFIRSIWHRNQGIPGGASGWFYKTETAGGGCFIDLGVHMIDMGLSFAGFPRILSVSGQLHNKFGETDLPGQEMDVDDFGTAYIRCENGLCISIEISWASHARQTGMCTEVYGTKGGAIRDGNAVEVMKREQGQITKTSFPTGINTDNMPSVQEDFVQAIIDDTHPQCSGEDGMLLMKILDAVAESSRTGHEVGLESA